MLQRGRGAGYLGALVEPAEGAEFVLSCIHHDPRWDHQVEDRGWYYAALVVALDIDVTSILPPLDTEIDPTGDDQFWIPTDVLARCGERGLPGAVSELRRYLRSGRDIDLAVSSLVPLASHSEAAGFVDDLFGVASLDEVEAALAWAPARFDESPWPELRRAHSGLDSVVRTVLNRRAVPPDAAIRSHVYRVANMWNAVGTPRPQPRLGDRGETTEQLLEAADSQPTYAVGFAQALRGRDSPADKALILAAARSGDEGSRAAALRALGEQDDDTLLDVGLPLLDETDEPDRLQHAVLTGLRRLTSPRAVDWARTSALDPASGYPARAVLAARAVDADLPQLRALLAWAQEDEAMYDQCNIVEALDRLDDSTAVDAVAGIYELTVYSYLRKRCALLLARLSPTFSDGGAVECLWDCEAETRRCGAVHASASIEMIERLTTMAVDPTEDEDTCQLAAQRLTRESR